MAKPNTIDDQDVASDHWDSVDQAGWESFPASDPPAVDHTFELEPSTTFAVDADAPPHALDATEQQALRDALDDVHRGWARYDQAIRDLGGARPFVEIRAAKGRHLEALRALSQRYGVEVPENAWPGRLPHHGTTRAACEAAVAAELDSIDLYDRLLQVTAREELLAVFASLQRASQSHHLPALRRCATHGAAGS